MTLSLKLRDTSQFSIENGVKIVVYGEAGMGKTRLCATCPTPVIFSAESGLMSLREYQLPYYEIKTIGDVRDAYNWARSSHEARQFQTVCLDSISDIAETTLSGIKNTPAAGGKKNNDGRAVYGDYNDEFYKILKDFRDLPGMHVYMSAKQDKIKTADGLVLNGPMLPGNKMNTQLPYVPDLLFQLTQHSVEKYRYLRCHPDFANAAKDRSGVLNEMESPDLGYVINKISSMVRR